MGSRSLGFGALRVDALELRIHGCRVRGPRPVQACFSGSLAVSHKAWSLILWLEQDKLASKLWVCRPYVRENPETPMSLHKEDTLNHVRDSLKVYSLIKVPAPQKNHHEDNHDDDDDGDDDDNHDASDDGKDDASDDGNDDASDYGNDDDDGDASDDGTDDASDDGNDDASDYGSDDDDDDAANDDNRHHCCQSRLSA